MDKMAANIGGRIGGQCGNGQRRTDGGGGTVIKQPTTTTTTTV